MVLGKEQGQRQKGRWEEEGKFDICGVRLWRPRHVTDTVGVHKKGPVVSA